MRVYSMVRPKKLSEIPQAMARAERLGYDGTTLLELTVPADFVCRRRGHADRKYQDDVGRFRRFSAQPDGHGLRCVVA